MAQVGLDPRQTQWAVLGPHQAAHLQLGPALQLAGQQVGPKKTGSTGEQDRLPRRGHRWRAGNRQAPATAQLGFLAQIEVPVAFGTSAIATIAVSSQSGYQALAYSKHQPPAPVPGAQCTAQSPTCVTS